MPVQDKVLSVFIDESGDIIYYDNEQIELTRILTSVFSTLYTNVEFRKVKPIDYKLFQVADLICTLELLADKANSNSFSKSEISWMRSLLTRMI